MPGFGKGGVRAQLLHILNCEQGWMHRVADRPWTANTAEHFGDAAAVESLRQMVAAETRALLESLGERELNAVLPMGPRD